MYYNNRYYFSRPNYVYTYGNPYRLNFSRRYPRVVVYNGQQNFGGLKAVGRTLSGVKRLWNKANQPVTLSGIKQKAAEIKQTAKDIYAKHGGKVRGAALSAALVASPVAGAILGEGAAAATPVPQTYMITQPATDMTVYEVNKGGKRTFVPVRRTDNGVKVVSSEELDSGYDQKNNSFVEGAANNYEFPKS